MTKFLVTASKSKVIFRKITKTNRPLTLVYNRMYRIDDELFCCDRESTDSFVYYDIDEQQPYGYGEYLNPDFTKVLIDSMKLAKGKPGRLIDFNFQTIAVIGVVLIVGISLVSQFLG